MKPKDQRTLFLKVIRLMQESTSYMPTQDIDMSEYLQAMIDLSVIVKEIDDKQYN